MRTWQRLATWETRSDDIFVSQGTIIMGNLRGVWEGGLLEGSILASKNWSVPLPIGWQMLNFYVCIVMSFRCSRLECLSSSSHGCIDFEKGDTVTTRRQ